MPTAQPKTSRLSVRDARVMRFIEEQKLPVKTDGMNTLTIKRDGSCSMGELLVNGACVMTGNDWDFHPGCHGFDVPDFKGIDALAGLLRSALLASGHAVEVVENPAWRYGEDEAPARKKSVRKPR